MKTLTLLLLCLMAATMVYSFTIPQLNPDWDPSVPLAERATFIKTQPTGSGIMKANRVRKGVYSKPTTSFNIHSDEYQQLLDSLDLTPEDRVMTRMNQRAPIPIWCDDRTNWWRNRNRFNYEGYTQNYTTGQDKMWFTRQGNFPINVTAAVFAEEPSAEWLEAPTDFPFVQRNRYSREMCGWRSVVAFVLPAYYFVDCTLNPTECLNNWVVFDEYFIQVLGPPDGIGLTERPEYDFWQVSVNIPFIGIIEEGWIHRSVAISQYGVANHHFNPYTEELYMLEYPGPTDSGYRAYLQGYTARVSGVMTPISSMILEGKQITSIEDPGVAACYDSFMAGTLPPYSIYGGEFPICSYTP